MDASAPSPSQRVETVEVDGHRVDLRFWEGEVLVRAGGWIVVLRGIGLAVALLAACASVYSRDVKFGLLLFVSALASVAVVWLGVCILCRYGSCRLALLCWVMGWIALTFHSAPLLFHVGRPYEVARLAAQPLLLLLLPAFLLPDLYAAYAVHARGSDQAFRPSAEPLARIADAWRVRVTGHVLVAEGMVALAIASAALGVFLAPAVALL